MVLCRMEIGSGVGDLVVVLDRDQLVALAPVEEESELLARVRRRFGTILLREGRSSKPVARAFRDYFAGRCAALARLVVDPGGSAFQREVWTALRAIPAGGRRTYVEVAQSIGRPRSIRAVAQAVAVNPIQLAIPCHRVTGAGGRVPGSELVAARRRWLLEHERRSAGALAPRHV